MLSRRPMAGCDQSYKMRLLTPACVERADKLRTARSNVR